MPATSKTMKTEVDGGKEEEGVVSALQHQPHHRKAWQVLGKCMRKVRVCQKSSKHLREAEIYRSFRAGGGLFIVHEKF